MRNLGIVLICLSALSFLLAVAFTIMDTTLWVSAEGLSRACSNLALIAIALAMWMRKSSRSHTSR